MDGARFLVKFLKNPGSVGAVWPSSRGLAATMVEAMDWARINTVVEYGAGTGVFTELILKTMRPHTKFLAVEIDGAMAGALRRRFPEIVVNESSVSEVRALCQQEGIGEVDAIISGLPWASFSLEDQQRFMAQTLDVLRPGGEFRTFAYLQGLLLPAGRRFKQLLDRSFAEVARSRVVWLNAPPAFVYQCRKGDSIIRH